MNNCFRSKGISNSSCSKKWIPICMSNRRFLLGPSPLLRTGYFALGWRRWGEGRGSVYLTRAIYTVNGHFGSVRVVTTFMCRLSTNSEASISWNSKVLSRPVAGKLYFCSSFRYLCIRCGSEPLGWCSHCSNSLRSGRFGVRTPSGARFSGSIRMLPASCTMGTASLPRR